MLKITNCLIVAILCATIIGCASTAKNAIAVGHGIEAYTATQGMGSIYIYRNQLDSSAMFLNLELDGKKVGFLEGNSHVRVDVPHGLHKIKAILNSSDPSEITVEVNEGQRYFIKHKIKYLISDSLVLIPEQGAVQEISKTNPAVTIAMKEDSVNKFIANNGYMYEGFSSTTNLNGYGKIIYPQENPALSYQGEVVGGKPSGKGLLLVKNGNKWEGDFKNGMIDRGIFMASNGLVYEGEFLSWHFHGKGLLKLLNGDIWKSDFIKDKALGRAYVTFASGASYEGDVVNWQFEGRGKLTLEKLVFDGVFKQSKFYSGDVFNNQGQLITKYANGREVNQSANISSTSTGSTISDILAGSIKLLGAVVSGYNQSQESRSKSQNYLLNDSDADPFVRRPSARSATTQHKSNFDSYSSECTSDFSCGTGSACVKKPYSNVGVCMKSVGSDGVRNFSTPSSDSIGVRTSEGCQFNADCPVGFSCDATYKACVKK